MLVLRHITPDLEIQGHLDDHLKHLIGRYFTSPGFLELNLFVILRW